MYPALSAYITVLLGETRLISQERKELLAETARYDERVRQIGREIFYAMQLVTQS
jgi:hypothetical protein